MISFVITSVNENFEYINETLRSIDNVCNDYEVLFVSDKEYTNDWVGNTKYIKTSLDTSVKNYNKGVSEAQGDVILLMPDDHFLLKDPRTIVYLSKRFPQCLTLDSGFFLQQRDDNFTNAGYDDHDVQILKKLTERFSEDPSMKYDTLLKV